MILKSHSNTLYLFSKYRIFTFPHLTTSRPVYHVFLLVFCSFPTLSLILNLSVTPCLSICQCYPPLISPDLPHHPPFSASQDSRHFSPQSCFTATGSQWGALVVALGEEEEVKEAGGCGIERRSCSLRMENTCITWGQFRTDLKARGTREEWTIHVHYVNTGEGAVRAGRWQSLCGEK